MLDAGVNLVLVFNAEGNVVEVKPNGEAALAQLLTQLLGKVFAVGSSIGNKGILKVGHAPTLRVAKVN